MLDFYCFKISHHPPLTVHAILVSTRQSLDSRWQLLDRENITSIRRSQVSEPLIFISVDTDQFIDAGYIYYGKYDLEAALRIGRTSSILIPKEHIMDLVVGI